MSEFPELIQATVISLRPGDVLVLKVQDRITANRAAEIKAHAEAVWPENRVVVTDRTDITVVRPEDAES